MKNKNETARYVCHGSVRGTCPHRHTTLAGAVRCLLRDWRRCESLGGGSYSDRRVLREGTPASRTEYVALTADQRETVERMIDVARGLL